jgi:hypothetical protein
MQPSGEHGTDMEAHARFRHRRATAALSHSPITRAWCRTPTGRATVASLADIPLLCDEIGRLDAGISRTRRWHQDLTAAARATLAADADGERDPLYYLRDELEAAEHSAPDRRAEPW